MTHPDPVAVAARALDALRAGDFAGIREMFVPKLREMLPVESLRAALTAELDRHGAVRSVGAPVTEPAGEPVTAVKFPVAFERDEGTVIVSVTDGGGLTGIQFAPPSAAEPIRPWQPPAYADPASFDEREVTLGDGPLAVPGTLSLPRRPGPLPAVVLLAGSGPADRDATLGRNKPLRDLAWGLASAGVAVLRFDKVTHTHPDPARAMPGFTVTDEYVPDAVAAVRLLREQPAVDGSRIFVLGHSLGGTVAPRVAAAAPDVAGLVIMAGGAQPMHRSTIRQVRYLAALNPETAPAAEPMIEALAAKVRAVDSPDLSPDTPAGDLPFGVPAPYWLDLRGYDAPAAAAALGRPVLILQGARDYQSTVADDLVLWREALAGRPGASIRVYDADNHLFFPGTGPSSPAEYEPAQHVDPAVVADIAVWLGTGAVAPPATAIGPDGGEGG